MHVHARVNTFKCPMVKREHIVDMSYLLCHNLNQIKNAKFFDVSFSFFDQRRLED